jgi:hypothetical protein
MKFQDCSIAVLRKVLGNREHMPTFCYVSGSVDERFQCLLCTEQYDSEMDLESQHQEQHYLDPFHESTRAWLQTDLGSILNFMEWVNQLSVEESFGGLSPNHWASVWHRDVTEAELFRCLFDPMNVSLSTLKQFQPFSQSAVRNLATMQIPSSCYVEARSANSLECLVCAKNFFSKAALDIHCSRPGHASKLELVQSDFGKVLTLMKRINRLTEAEIFTELDKLEQSTCPVWKNAIHAELFRHLMNPEDSGRTTLHALSKFEYCERLALLQLAVWKAECIQLVPRTKDSLSCKLWMQHKSEQTESNAMAIVVEAVRPFLTPPKNFAVSL